MGLKILHSADWHMGSGLGSLSREQREFLRHEQLQLPGKIARLCRREECDLVLLAGDIFEGIPGKEVLGRVCEALAECGVPVLISPGNHDFCGPGSPWLEASLPDNVYVFTGELTSLSIPALDCRVYGAGYRSMDCPPLLENFQLGGTERYQIGLLHGDPVSGTSPCCPVTSGQIRRSGLDYLALGHIHKAGMTRQGKTLCAWPGCPMGRGWDETGEKGVCIVTLGQTAQIRFAGVDAPGFYDLEADISADPEAAVGALLPAAGNRNFYRITLTGQGPVNSGALEKQFSQFPNLSIRDRTEAPLDLWEEAGEDSFRGIYFGMLKRLAEQEPAAVLAAELSHRLLQGKEIRLP